MVGPYIVIKVSQAAVAFSGPVELSHLGDAETGHELPPDGGTQPIAQCHAHPVLTLHLLVWLVQQVAADLANVLYNLGGMERLTRTPLPGPVLFGLSSGEAEMAQHAQSPLKRPQ